MKYILTTLLLTLSISVFALEPEEIMKQAYEKCLSIETGNISYDFEQKFFSGPVSKSRVELVFSRNNSKVLSTFHKTVFTQNGVFKKEVLYIGKELAIRYDDTANLHTAHGGIYLFASMALRELDLKPLTGPKQSMLNYKRLKGELRMLDIVAEDDSFYQVKFIYDQNHKRDKMGYTPLFNTYNFWINKEDMMPLKWTEEIVMMYTDTVTQVRKYNIRNYDLNTVNKSTAFIRPVMNAKVWRNADHPEIEMNGLEVNSYIDYRQAFAKSMDSVVSIDSVHKLILLDFFYKECPPCIASIPHTEKIWNKYKDKGLLVLGVDPINTQNEMVGFVEHYNFTYPVIFPDRSIEKEFHIQPYPMFILLDQQGKILYVQEGYFAGNRKLKKVIKKNL